MCLYLYNRAYNYAVVVVFLLALAVTNASAHFAC